MFSDKIFRGALFFSLLAHGGLVLQGSHFFSVPQPQDRLPYVEVIYYAPPSAETRIEAKRVEQPPEEPAETSYQLLQASHPASPPPAPSLLPSEDKTMVEIPIPEDLPRQFVPIFIDYYKVIRLKILHFVDYPLIARKAGQEGTAYCNFNLDSQGRLKALHLEQGSGVLALDESALQSIRAAAPFPPFPSNLPQEKLTFRLQIAFQLD